MKSKYYSIFTWQIIFLFIGSLIVLSIIPIVWIFSTVIVGNIIATTTSISLFALLLNESIQHLCERKDIIKTIFDEWDSLVFINNANLTEEDIEKIKGIDHNIINEVREQLSGSKTLDELDIVIDNKIQNSALSPITFCEIYPHKTIVYKNELYHGLAHGKTIELEWTGEIDKFISLMKHELAHLYLLECNLHGESNHHFIMGKVGL